MSNELTVTPMSEIEPRLNADDEGTPKRRQGERGPQKKPANWPKKDREAGLQYTTRRTPDGAVRYISQFHPDKALEVVERIAQGEMLTEIVQDKHMPSRHTFMRWLLEYPELRKAYDQARELSAMVLEEEALLAGRHLKQSPGTAQKVRAHEVLMNQLRWSAARRDPKRFGEKRESAVVVPIQINTTLDMGGGSGEFDQDGRSMYDLVIDAEVVQSPDEDTPLLPQGEEEEERSLMEVPPEKPRGKLKLTPRMGMHEKLDYSKKKPNKLTQKKDKSHAKRTAVSERDDGGVPEEGEGEAGEEWGEGT